MFPLLLFQLKQTFRKKSTVLLFLVLPIIFAYLPIFIQQSAGDKNKIYSAAIVDRDQSSLSTKLIDDMKSYDELHITEYKEEEPALSKLRLGRYDVVYIIKEGFEQEILQARMNDLLIAHTTTNTPSVKWINDQISLRIMRLWSYHDIFSKIREFESSYNPQQYRKVYLEKQKEEPLLVLNVQSLQHKGAVLSDNRVGFQVFIRLWTYIVLFLAMGSARRVMEDRLSGRIDRLGFAGISAFHYQMVSFTRFLLVVFPIFTLSLLLLNCFAILFNMPLLMLERLSFGYSVGLIFTNAVVSHFIFSSIAKRSSSISSYTAFAQIATVLILLINTFGTNLSL